MKVRPQDPPVDMLDHLQQVMMIAPVDADENKAKQVAEKNGAHWTQRIPTGVMWHPQFQHHDGNDDRNHTIAECFHSTFAHFSSFLIGNNSIVTPSATSSST